MGKNQHVTPHNSGWQVKGVGNSKATAVTKTQAEAITIAKSIAKNNKSEVVIHGTNGRIREKTLMGMTHFLQKVDSVKAKIIRADQMVRPFSIFSCYLVFSLLLILTFFKRTFSSSS